MPKLFSLLRKSTLFRGIPVAKLRRIWRISKTLEFQAGTRIFNKRDLANQMFLVAYGRVRIYITSSAKKRKTFAYLGPGSFFGEMALLEARERSASAEAVDDCRLIVIHKRDFKRFLLHDPQLCYHILKTLCHRLRNMDEQIENLLFRNVMGRVTKTLVDLAQQHGTPRSGGILIQDAYSRQELADLVGTTREPLSRALANLRRAQLVSFQDERIFLRNPKRMEALIGATGATEGDAN